ncbi:MAG: LON peptidase substrate-binding domain-containing protein [Actinomycetota bacterium]|nr:LON peptidase substrate-binding domain-containing protein [Actinomycetota bacterium]
MADIIPVFPLSHVLVPGMPLPLRIFEPRYLDLLADATSGPGNASFGVVALRRGTEALLPNAPADVPDLVAVGTVAEIVEVEANDDGTQNVLAVGSRRFSLGRLITDGTAYLRAEVEWLAEADGHLLPGQIPVTQGLCREFARLLALLTGLESQEPLPEDANLLSYYVASQIPLDPGDRQSLLADPTAADRLRRAAGLLRREIRLLKSTRSIAIAPSVLWMIAKAN